MNGLELICEAGDDVPTTRWKTTPEKIDAVVERPERIVGDQRPARIEVTLVRVAVGDRGHKGRFLAHPGEL